MVAHQVQLPDAVMLRDGQRLQRPVEGPTRICHEPLLHQQVQILWDTKVGDWVE